MTPQRFSPLLASTMLCCTIFLTSCTEDPASVRANATAPAATPAPPASCADAADRVKQHLKRSEVASVAVEGQCTTVVVTTTLADADTKTGKELCDKAAEVAYTGDINSVRVLSMSGKELSNGITKMKCLAG